MADASQQGALNPYAGLLYRKAQLLAQEQQAMGAQPPMPQTGLIGNPQAQGMSQTDFSGYGQPKQQMSPQQMQQLLMLLRRNQ